MAVAINPQIAEQPLLRHGRLLRYSADAFTWLLGFLVPFSMRLVGDLPLAEALLVPSLPLLIFLRGRRALRPKLNVVYGLMGLWLLGLVIADAYNHIDFTDRLRGNALIIFFALDLVGLSILVGRNDRRKILLFIGMTVGALVSVKLQPSQAAADYPWKFGYAWGTIQVAIFISYLFYRKRRYIAATITILAICGINLLFNFRSPVLNLLIVLALVFPIVPERLGRLRILPRPGTISRTLVLACLALSAGAGANALVGFVTRAGYIGEDAQAKNESQEKTGNLLLGGRPEFVIGLRAALDSPVIGHGSWAKDLTYFEMQYDMMVEAGVEPEKTGGDISEDADGLIPGHSHIVTAWVWAGIAGPIFWLYILSMVVRSLVQISSWRPPLSPIYGQILVGLFWDILFSPFAFNRRFGEAFAIVIMADLLESKVQVRVREWVRLRKPYAMLSSGRRMPIQRKS